MPSELTLTPGPWEFDGDNPANQGFDVGMPDGGVLATAYYDTDRDAYSVAQAEANARLIAAAPDLLAACRAALEFLGQRTHNTVDPHTLEDLLGWCGGPALAARLREALLKAEGAVPPT
jgi:hypothetical protein